MELTIREADITEFTDLCGLFDEGDVLHRENLPHIFWKPKVPLWDEKFMRGLISDENIGLFVAETEDQVAGLVYAVVRESPPVPIFIPRRYAMVDNLIVKEKFRHAGIGRALMERIHEWAGEKGLDTVELNVWEFNKPAIDFYRKLGYETSSRMMSKRLNQAHDPR